MSEAPVDVGLLLPREGERDPPARWLDQILRDMAREAVDHKLITKPEDHVCWIAADRLKVAESRAVLLPELPDVKCGPGKTMIGVELETRRPVYIHHTKIAAVIALIDTGPTRLLFVGGGHVDVCGSAEIWATELRLAELAREAREARGP